MKAAAQRITHDRGRTFPQPRQLAPSPAAPREVPIESALARLGDAAARLIDVTSRVRGRASPVLGPVMEKTAETGGGPAVPNAERVSQRIHETADLLDASINSLEDVYERLEV